jgi:hypothetical protein
MLAQTTNMSLTTIPTPVNLIHTGRSPQLVQNRIYYHWVRIREITAYSYSVAHSRHIKEGHVWEAVSPFPIC